MENLIPASALKGVTVIEQFISLPVAYILTSQIALQKIFKTTTNGALAVIAGTRYYFECEFDLSAMSATTGTFSFGFLGTATFTSVKYTSQAQKSATIGTPATLQITKGTVATATPIVSTSIITTGSTRITGVIEINASGTIIPAIGLSVAAPAVVGVESFFKIYAISPNTINIIGTWT